MYIYTKQYIYMERATICVLQACRMYFHLSFPLQGCPTTSHVGPLGGHIKPKDFVAATSTS